MRMSNIINPVTAMWITAATVIAIALVTRRRMKTRGTNIAGHENDMLAELHLLRSLNDSISNMHILHHSINNH
jgi:hypothetical protein